MRVSICGRRGIGPTAKEGASKGAWLEAAAEALMTEGSNAVKSYRLATDFGIGCPDGSDEELAG